MTLFIDFYYSGTSIIRAQAALRRFYPRYSLKRKTAYLINALNLLVLHRIPRAMWKIREIVSEIPTSAPSGALAILLHKIEQNGRIYAFELDDKGDALTVTKIALTDSARSGVVREHVVLKQLASAVLPFYVPRVVSFSDSKGQCILCMSAINQRLRIHKKSKGLPDYIFDAIASLRPLNAPLVLPRSAFEWFDSTQKRVTNPAITAIARQIAPDNLFVVCAAHCDLGSENIFSTGEIEPDKPMFAVIDWEFFTETAPAMTDRVAYWLGQHHRNFKREIGAWDGKVSAAYFLNEFRNTPGGEAAAVLALLALLHMGNDLAERLCEAAK